MMDEQQKKLAFYGCALYLMVFTGFQLAVIEYNQHLLYEKYKPKP